MSSQDSFDARQVCQYHIPNCRPPKEVCGLFWESFFSFKESELSSDEVVVQCLFFLLGSISRNEIFFVSFMESLSIAKVASVSV